MEKIIVSAIALSVFLGIPAFGQAASKPNARPQNEKPATKVSASSPQKYQFIEFTASQKNMFSHGILLDVETGKMWMVESQNTSEGTSNRTVPVAVPVAFEPLKRNSYIYSPAETDLLSQEQGTTQPAPGSSSDNQKAGQ